MHGAGYRPALSSLLSQVLVAYTVEFDNEFERRMGEAGYTGARLSLVVWANLMRFVGEGGSSVRDLTARALAPATSIRFQLGCLERWGFVRLNTGSPSRDGWGSGRGIRADWMVRLTSRGKTASGIWPPLFDEIGWRWERRFGFDAIRRLRQALQDIADRLEIELPDGLPGIGLEDTWEFPRRVTHCEGPLPLPTLLSRVLLAFRIEFDRESPVALAWCANMLRVLSDKPIRTMELPRLTGCSPETSAIGWQIRPFVVVEPDPEANRGKVVRLSARGLSAQQTYSRLVCEIEKRWETRFGEEIIRRLRESLRELFELRGEDGLLLAQGLAPPPGTVRAGDHAPALGRRDVGAAARKRMRDLVAQTGQFVRDPAGALPHYPLWDMNRGFGP